MSSHEIADAPRALLTEVVRGGRLESVHHGSIAIVRDDELWWGSGDPHESVWSRSVVKPFQAQPLICRGVAERLAMTRAELAVTSASHDGTEEHVGVVRSLLEKGDLTGEDLRCGPHAPFDRRASVAIAVGGRKPERIHNNCSGKHAGFLLLAQECGVPLADYLEPDSASQGEVLGAVAAMCGVDAASVAVAIDGCGAPTLRLPLVAVARGFARLLNRTPLEPVRATACERLLDAISAEPILLAGQDRLCTRLVQSAPGRIYPKNGAEGIYAFGAQTAAGTIGVAIKVADGAERGYFPVVLEVLRRTGMWPDVPRDDVPESLARFARPPVINTQQKVVGEIRCAVDWSSW